MVFLFILLTIVILLIFSKFKIEVINFQFSSYTKRHINEDYKIVLKCYILSKIPILKFNITKTKLEKLEVKDKIKKIDFKVIKDNKKYDKKLIQTFKKANILIKKINLNIEIGTENAVLTSIIIPIISSVFSILLQKKVKKFEDQIFLVKPVYINQNLLNIVFSGIFEIKMKHIINIIYVLNKKEGVKKYERTSDRRPYDYSYE